MGLAKFSLDLQPVGGSEIIINGQDIAKHVKSIQIRHGLDHVPELFLEMLGEGHIEGEGIVNVVSGGENGDTAPLGETIAEWLEQFDAEELWATAVQSYGIDKSPTQLILGALAERAREQLKQQVSLT